MKEDFSESVDLITKHLVKSHIDKDEKSLFVRFNQIVRYLGEVNERNDLLNNALKRIAKGRETE